MNKLKITGLSNLGKRSVYIFQKENSFFSLFPIFLDSLNLEKLGTFYTYDAKPFNIKELVDNEDHTENKDYDLDVYYGKDKIIVVIRTNEKNREKVINEIKKISEFPIKVNKAMDDFNEEAKKKLIDLYSRYLKNPKDNLIHDTAEEIHKDYMNATGRLLDEKTSKAVDQAVYIAFGKLSITKAKQILGELKQD